MRWTKPDLTRPQVAYLVGSAGFAMLSSTFSFYYVKVFLDHYRISQTSFQVSQIVYLIWNAINDPLFAYVQDNAQCSLVRTRRHALLYGAPFWAVSFLVAWFPWEHQGSGTWITGFHLMFTLCFYDAIFSFNGLAMCCLYSEISSKQAERVKLTRWDTVTKIIASGCLYLTEEYSDSLNNFRNFQIICVVLATCSVFLNVYAGTYAQTESECSGQSRQQQLKGERKESIWRLAWQLLTNRNFLAFVTINFAGGFSGTFVTSFMAIFTENLVPVSIVPRYIRSLCYSSRSLISVALILIGAPIVNRVGYYRIIRGSFFVKIGLAVFLYMFGWTFRSLILIFMVVESSIAGAMFSLYNIPLADIAEEERVKHKRSLPNTSMTFGTNALVVKPVFSLAPMITTALLEANGYRQHQENKLSGPALENLHQTMFTLICVVPVIVSIVQYFAWSQFQLRNTHETKVSDLKESFQNEDLS